MDRHGSLSPGRVRPPLRCHLHSVTTVQEEIGLRGAKTAAGSIDPSVAIAVDVTHASDCPTIDKQKHGNIAVGGGPVIFRGPNINAKVAERLIELCETNSMPYQLAAVGRATPNDANALQIHGGGVATGLVAIPNRYMHSAVEVVSLSDMDHIANLLALFARSLSPDDDFTPGLPVNAEFFTFPMFRASLRDAWQTEKLVTYRQLRAGLSPPRPIRFVTVSAEGTHMAKLLLVEDSPTQAVEIRMLLEEGAHEVMHVANGQLAMEVLDAQTDRAGCHRSGDAGDERAGVGRGDEGRIRAHSRNPGHRSRFGGIGVQGAAEGCRRLRPQEPSSGTSQ